MNDETRLLLVAGFPSGGTDLMKNVLNAHPAIYISGEVPFLNQLGPFAAGGAEAPLSRSSANALKEKIVSLDVYGRVENPSGADKFLENGGVPTIERLLYEMVTDKPVRVRGFKTPQFTEQLGALSGMLPSARFVVVVRDIRDVCLSWEKKWGKDKYLCADKWSRRMRSGWEVAKALPDDRTLFVTYERLLTDTEQVCRDLCRFVGVDYSDAMPEYHRFVDAAEDGKINYGRAIVKENFGKWRSNLAPGEARRVEEIAFETLELFGYRPEHASGPRGITRTEKLRGLLRDVASMLFVGNRKMSLGNNLRSRLLNVLIEIRKRRA